MTQWQPQKYLWPVGILLWLIVACLVTFVLPDTALRPIIVLSFLLICPGMALSRLLRLKNALIELLLGIALSITLDSIVACVLLYTGQWSPTFILEILLVLSLAGSVGQVLMERMLAQNIPMLSTDTPVPSDIRMQLALYNTMVLPSTPRPGDISTRDTLMAERIAPQPAAFTEIAEINTIAVPRIPRKKALFRNALEIDTAATKRAQVDAAHTQQRIPDTETLETRQSHIAHGISEMDTVATPAMSRRDIAFANTHNAEAFQFQRAQRYKAIVPSITDLETAETQAPIRKTTLRDVSQ